MTREKAIFLNWFDDKIYELGNLKHKMHYTSFIYYVLNIIMYNHEINIISEGEEKELTSKLFNMENAR